MASFRFELDHKPTRNEKYNLYLIVSIANKRTKKKTGIQLDRIEDFNPKGKRNNWVRNNVFNAKALNEQLRLIILEATETYNEMEGTGDVTSAGIIRTMTKETVSSSFLQFAEERAKQIEEEGGFRNARKYFGLVNKLKEFRKKQRMSDITMEDLSVEFLTRFNNFLHKWKNLKEKGKLLHPNSIEVQFTIFKALVNRAIKLDLLPFEKNPFLKFKYKGVPTFKEKLDEEEIKKIMALDFPKGSLIWNVRNCFLFSFFCAGIRAGDLLQLRWSNITSDGRINYTMNKNSKNRDMVLVPQALEILKNYVSHESKPTDYIFPFLDPRAEYAKYTTVYEQKTMVPMLRTELYRRISAKNALLNKYLKKIAEKAEITKNLSFHIARHSFAKIAKESEVDNSIIKELLAHSSLAVTERYMGNFDTKKTDNALKSLFGSQGASKETKKDNKDEVINLLKKMSKEDIETIFKTIKGS